MDQQFELPPDDEGPTDGFANGVGRPHRGRPDHRRRRGGRGHRAGRRHVSPRRQPAPLRRSATATTDGPAPDPAVPARRRSRPHPHRATAGPAAAGRRSPVRSSSRTGPKPPTGDVPQVLIGEDAPPAEETEDDLDAWSSFASSSPRWRDADDSWDEDQTDFVAGPGPRRRRAGSVRSRTRTPGPPIDEIFSFHDLEAQAEDRTSGVTRRFRTGHGRK